MISSDEQRPIDEGSRTGTGRETGDILATMRKQHTPAAAEQKRAATKSVPRKTGRPPIYGQKHKDRICAEIAAGRTLTAIMRDEGMPQVYWVFTELGRDEAFAKAYARAREIRAELLVEELVTIADDGSNDTYVDENGNRRIDHDVIARSRLRVEARKRLVSKLLPKVYGDRVTTEVTGAEGGPVQVEDGSTAKLAALLAKVKGNVGPGK